VGLRENECATLPTHFPATLLISFSPTQSYPMAPARWRVSCPNCQMTFADSFAVIHHLNHPYSSCAHWFFSTHPPSPLGPTTTPSHPSTAPLEGTGGTSIPFPSAGHIFANPGSFMENFHTDQFSEEHSQNPFYPFSSRGEWQLVSFLSWVELSMRFINEFLSLDFISDALTSSTISSDPHGRFLA
jgi:hypothetical protein